jgi:hypothetical protein
MSAAQPSEVRACEASRGRLAVNSRREASAQRLRDVREPLGPNALVHLFAVHRHVLGRRKAEAQLIAPHGEHSDGDVIADFH